MKKCFQKNGNQLRFTWTVNGKEKSFEFYWEPFEGSLKSNIETFSKWFSEDDTRKKFYAVNLLAQAKDESAIPTLIAAVKEPGFPGRATAAAGLSHFKGKRKVLKALLDALSSADYSLTTTAISSLGALGSKKAIKPLRKILNHCLEMKELFTTEPSAAPAAVLAVCTIDSLLSLGIADVAQELLPFFEHPHWAVRYRAAQAASKNPSPLYIQALKKLSSACEIPVRVQSAEALIRNGEKEGRAALARSALSDDYVERSTAVSVLGSLPAEIAKEILAEALQKEKDISLRMEIAAHLINFTEEMPLADFETGLSGENPFIRLQAVTLLSRLSAFGSRLSASVREILRKAQATEPDEFLRSQIRRALQGNLTDSLDSKFQPHLEG